jgi:hypothetical protein
MEWIIVDDGTDKIEDLIKEANIPQIQYFSVPNKMTLGAKRNLTHSKTKGSIIVYMDDDDYYPPERVSHAVQKLQETPNALCAGSSEIYVYFKHIQKMYQAGPYGPNHATAGTFAFRRELLNITKYNETASLAEEKEFLKNYTIPFVQLDPLKCILVFAHIQNTFDKRKLLENENQFFKLSDKKVEDFIRYDAEVNIKRFFLKEIDQKLSQYKLGDPIMKPDVLKQIKQIEAERDEMIKTQSQQNGSQIILQQPGTDPRPLKPEEVVQLIQEQQKQLETKTKEIQELQARISFLERQQNIKPLPMYPVTVPAHNKNSKSPVLKSTPEIMVEI